MVPDPHRFVIDNETTVRFGTGKVAAVRDQRNIQLGGRTHLNPVGSGAPVALHILPGRCLAWPDGDVWRGRRVGETAVTAFFANDRKASSAGGNPTLFPPYQDFSALPTRGRVCRVDKARSAYPPSVGGYAAPSATLTPPLKSSAPIPSDAKIPPRFRCPSCRLAKGLNGKSVRLPLGGSSRCCPRNGK
jgi:hypothetical protein